MSFPSSPINGQSFTNTLGTSWLYDATRQAWLINSHTVIGETGIQGPQGDTGIQGVQGATGTQGIQGVQGDTGIQGVQGDTGVQGVQGVQGSTGTQGIQGATGIQGVTGVSFIWRGQWVEDTTYALNDVVYNLGSSYVAIGPSGGDADKQPGVGEHWTDAWQLMVQKGATGVQGTTGVQGIQGNTGVQGTTGVQGIQGATGVQGIQGATGTQGNVGAQGTTGVQGIQGNTGVQGTTGSQGATGITVYWKAMPATPTRISNISFKVAGDYSQLLSRGVVFKWQDATAIKHGMDASSNITGTDTTVNLIGDILTADATLSSMVYAVEKARQINFAIPGTLATGTDLAGHFYAPYLMHVFGADVFVTTAGTTNNTAFDATQGSTSMFSVKPFITSGNTSGISMTADSSQVVAAGTAINVGVYNVSTTAPVDGWIQLYFVPENNKRL